MSSVPARHALFDRAKYLAAASAVEYGVQLMVPIFLVRALSHEDFASYRFMWLVSGTLTGSLLLGFPASLYYFVPRASGREQAGYVVQTTLFCALLAFVACAALWLAGAVAPGLDFLRLVPRPMAPFVAFLVLIGATNVLDFLPAARGDLKAQAALNLAVALLRAACTIGGAWSGSIAGVCWGLLAYAGGRMVLQLVYVARRVPMVAAAPDAWFDAARFRAQFAYAVPFGVANAFWSLRTQSEGWVGASILQPHEYALLTIAGVMSPVVMLVRQAVTAAVTASINRLEAQGDMRGMVRLNADANVVDTSYTYPVIAFFFVTSAPLFSLLYTPAYAEAAVATKLVCVGLLALTIETTTLVRALGLRGRVLRFEAAMLLGSIAMSVAGGLAFGFVGVVLGSVLSRCLSTCYWVTSLARYTQVPLREFQHWSRLGATLLCALAAAAVGWTALEACASHSNVVQLAASSAAFGLTYLLLAAWLGVPLPGRGMTASLPRQPTS